MPAAVGSGNQAQEEQGKYIRDTVRGQLVPMAIGCYQELLERQPGAAGRLVLDFVIAGDERVGGVVDQVELGKDTDLTDPDFATCVRESMYGVVFAPPPKGEHYVTVSYPFNFAP